MSCTERSLFLYETATNVLYIKLSSRTATISMRHNPRGYRADPDIYNEN